MLKESGDEFSALGPSRDVLKGGVLATSGELEERRCILRVGGDEDTGRPLPTDENRAPLERKPA